MHFISRLISNYYYFLMAFVIAVGFMSKFNLAAQNSKKTRGLFFSEFYEMKTNLFENVIGGTACYW